MPSKTELRRLARRFDLTIVGCHALTIRRRKAGRGFSYTDPEGRSIKDVETLRRLKSLAVPPAYRDVMFAADPRAHLQAVGYDTAGRLQYRYHPDWTRVREAVKAQKLADLAESLPAITRAVQRALKRPEPDRRMALAAAVQLVALTAIRAGSDAYAQEHGTRGATTLLKTHVKIEDDRILLCFKGKGGKIISKEARHTGLAEALRRLRELPGRRLFKYRDAKGALHAIRASDVNAFLKGIGRSGISLKDFRTLAASMGVLDRLARQTPETSAAKRRKQINAAVAPLAEELANTLTVCRTSYVHDTVISAFEAGKLSTTALRARSPAAKAALLADLLGSGARKRIKAAKVEARTVRQERPVLGGAVPAG